MEWLEHKQQTAVLMRVLVNDIQRLMEKKGSYKIDEILTRVNEELGRVTPEFRRLTLLSRLALVSSEVGEAIEEARRPTYVESQNIKFLAIEEEIADIMIRCLSIAGEYQMRVVDAMMAKLEHVDRDRPELQQIGKVI